MSAGIALEVDGLVKSFGGVHALQGASLTVGAGEIHALLGQNGCGKSTLVKILTGVHNADAGRVGVFGEDVSLPLTDSRAHGIAVVHQDIGLVDTMTVLENLGVASGYGTRLLGSVATRALRARFEALSSRIGFAVPMTAMVADLSSAERAFVGILRAISQLSEEADGHILILDEPTAALGRSEADRLLDLMRNLAAQGTSIVFISHRLNEVFAVADRITVMRDGRTVLTADAAAVDRSSVVEAMLGRRLDEFFPSPSAAEARPPVLELRGLTAGVLEGFDLDVRPTEIVGVTGLAGMGQEDIARILSGAESPRAGTIEVGGAAVAAGSPRALIRAGVAVVPGNRLRDGCWIAGSASENLSLPVLPEYRSWAGLSTRRERAEARTRLADVNLHPLQPELELSAFSGGNQQKVVFAKWLQLRPAVLVLEEPTQGVDAGAAKELLSRVVDVASAGTGVLLISGDHEQLVELCHRVIVLHDGVVVAEIPREALSEPALLAASSPV